MAVTFIGFRKHTNKFRKQKNIRMKKIKLLFLMTILVIGIQGCSIDQGSFEENTQLTEKGDDIPKNAVRVNNHVNKNGTLTLVDDSDPSESSCYKKILVAFKSAVQTQEDFETKIDSVTARFSDAYFIPTPTFSCSTGIVFSCYVPCDEIPNQLCYDQCGAMTANFTGGTVVLKGDKNTTIEDPEDDGGCPACPIDTDFVLVDNPDPFCSEIMIALRYL